MSTLCAVGLTARFDDVVLFDDLDLTLPAGLCALTGPNGAGKTTLARRFSDQIGARYVAQRGGAGCFAALAGVEDELRALRRLSAGRGRPEDVELVHDWTLEARLAEALAALDLSIDPLRPLGTVSGGERVRARLAAARLDPGAALVLDEPTNHLDAHNRARVIAWLQTLPRALVITHDREVLAVCSSILELRAGRLTRYGGGLDLFEQSRALADNARARAVGDAEKAERAARRAAHRAREKKAKVDGRGRRARREGGVPRVVLGAMKERAEGTGRRLAEVSARRVDEARARLAEARATDVRDLALGFALPGSEVRPGRVVVELRGVGVSGRLREVDLKIQGPRRVAITGKNGAGKSTLLRVIAGTLQPDAGSARAVPHAWLDQELALPDEGASVLANLQLAAPRLRHGACRERLAAFGFPRDDVEKRAAVLSGGERLRLALCLVLRQDPPPPLLLLDEPTNHLDLDTLQVLERAVRGFPGAVVVASHDERFLEGIGVDARLSLEA